MSCEAEAEKTKRARNRLSDADINRILRKSTRAFESFLWEMIDQESVMS